MHFVKYYPQVHTMLTQLYVDTHSNTHTPQKPMYTCERQFDSVHYQCDISKLYSQLSHYNSQLPSFACSCHTPKAAVHSPLRLNIDGTWETDCFQNCPITKYFQVSALYISAANIIALIHCSFV